MPPDGVPLQPSDRLLLSREEIRVLAALFGKHGVDKVRLTGGEPLLRTDLVDIVSDLTALGAIRQVGMTTNGVTLKRKLPCLVQAGLTHVNISLDTLQPDVFEELTRRPGGGLTQVLSSVHLACELLPPLQQQHQPQQRRVKLNVVVMKGVNDGELEDFCNLTRQLPLDVRFIEFMPFHDNGWNQGKFVSYAQMQTKLQHLRLQRLQDGPNDTTKWWKLPQDDALGRIGFITSMSDHFCGTCNRLRLTADGKLKACLFGSSEVSLRDALRSGYSTESIEKLIHYAVQRKTFALGGHGSAQGIAKANDNRPMTLIGG
jgi:cyclic pyranopterin phosphate synthase